MCRHLGAVALQWHCLIAEARAPSQQSHQADRYQASHLLSHLVLPMVRGPRCWRLYRHQWFLMCAQGTVGQLDHYLPISEFSELGLTALNLVPACGDCNKKKLTYIPSSEKEQLIHPYFDEVEERWLYAEVNETTPPSLRFFVTPPAAWDAIKSDRIRKHFDFFRLNGIYKSQAAEEMLNRKRQ